MQLGRCVNWILFWFITVFPVLTDAFVSVFFFFSGTLWIVDRVEQSREYSCDSSVCEACLDCVGRGTFISLGLHRVFWMVIDSDYRFSGFSISLVSLLFQSSFLRKREPGRRRKLPLGASCLCFGIGH